jgi:hypothetical protein
MNRYLRLNAKDEIWVITNQDFSENMGDWQEVVLVDYGRLANRVRFLDANEVATIPQTIGGSRDGWFSQQILKLMVARLLRTDRYLVLDAKNHLVFPMFPEFFEVRGKLRSTSMDYNGHPMARYLDRSLRYFGLHEQNFINSSLPTITPFVFPTSVVRALIDAVCEREKDDFPRSFGFIGSTEFLLFAGYLCSRPDAIGGIYDLSCRQCPVIWETTAERGFAFVKPILARVESERLPFFTVHRRAFSFLDDKSKKATAGLWCRRQLFQTAEIGLKFLAGGEIV